MHEKIARVAISIVDQIHQKALEISSRYRRTEADLIEALQQVEQHRVFLAKGCSSLFQYCVRELSLSENVAYNLITVSRKSREVPELKAALTQGTITLTNAKRIAPVLNAQNKFEWLKKASELSHRELEKEIVRVRPEAATPERVTYVTPTRVNLSVGLSEKGLARVRRAQDVLCQLKRRVEWAKLHHWILISLEQNQFPFCQPFA